MNLSRYDDEKIKTAACTKFLSCFVQEFWTEIVPNELIWNWHMQVLCDEIQTSDELVFKREPKLHDLIVNIPPGTSKTKIVSVFSTAWELGRMPGIRVFVGSYSDAAITGISDEIRLVMKSDKYQLYFPQTIIRKDRDSLHNFKTTENGEFYAFTVGGTLTSKHADILKVDDPLNPKQAVSAIELKNTNDFFDRTLPTRKVDKDVTPIYLIMQRLASGDPTGHLLAKKGERIRHICLPGTISKNVKPVEYKQFYIDGYLDPVRLGPAALAELQEDLGTEGYAGQIDQTPVPEGGYIWQRWFKEIPDNDFPDIEKAQQVSTDWDLAYTSEETNAASAYVTTGMIGTNIYIFDLDWKWLEFPELIRWMKTITAPHYIEAKASGKSAKQVLTNNGINAIEVNIKGGSDKIARARSATPTAEAGRVYIKKSLADRLYNDSKQGILFFPKGQYKDLADALAQALQRRSKATSKVVVGNENSDNGYTSALPQVKENPLDYI